jgi:hypothetical protein
VRPVRYWSSSVCWYWRQAAGGSGPVRCSGCGRRVYREQHLPAEVFNRAIAHRLVLITLSSSCALVASLMGGATTTSSYAPYRFADPSAQG